jgi:glycosidase
MKTHRRFFFFLACTAIVAAWTACGNRHPASDEVVYTTQPLDPHIDRIEPECWWTGMNMPLQLLVHGKDIGACDVRVRGAKDVKVSAVHKADSPDYLFVDLAIGAHARPATLSLEFTCGDVTFRQPYDLFERREGSAERGSFTTADMIYLIMPDRFANGDPTNDTVEGMAEGVDRANSFGRHGGDLQGIIDHLDYLEQLGVTAIWCTPLTVDNDRRASFHGYACADYYHIDPRYGSNELFRTYVQECHSRGIKVITDFVPNHCGLEHWWMKNLPFEDWIHQFPHYTGTIHCFSTNMDPHAYGKDLALQESGWFVRSMPDMNLDNSFVLRYFQQLAIWWLEWSGLDGIRIDTYPYNEKIPSSQLCKAITDEYPAMNIVGECWTESVPQLAYWQGGNTNADGFDSHLPSIMDFPLRSAIIKGVPEENPGWGEGLTRLYDVLSHDFVYHDLSRMMIFASNHDTPRLGDLVNGSIPRMKMITALLATLRGIPQTYYGDELMFRATPGAGGDSAWRGDFFGGWEEDTLNLFTREGRSAAQNDLYDYNCRIWQWRKTCRAIHEGQILHFLTRDNTYAFFRYIDSPTPSLPKGEGVHSPFGGVGGGPTLDDAVFVFANNNDHPVTIPWDYYDDFTPRLSATGIDVATGREIVLSATTEVPAHTVLIVDLSR